MYLFCDRPLDRKPPLPAGAAPQTNWCRPPNAGSPRLCRRHQSVGASLRDSVQLAGRNALDHIQQDRQNGANDEVAEG